MPSVPPAEELIHQGMDTSVNEIVFGMLHLSTWTNGQLYLLGCQKKIPECIADKLAEL
jgi:hypothetical protein